ncbi:g3992 [Coccomyxa elongata]
MQAIRPSWQLEPQRALDAHALQSPRPRPLRARPSRWGDSEPLLVADLGHLELAGEVAYGSQQRRDLELQVSRALLAHFGPHLAAVVQRGTPGAADRRLECWFDTVPAATAARHAAAEDQLVRLRAVPGSGDVAVPVKLSASRLHCQHTCVILHGLPYEYCTEGLTQILLDCAGCPRDTHTVRGEFFGDLAGELAASSHLIGNGSACLAYIQTPDDDRHLGRLPKHSSSMATRGSTSRALGRCASHASQAAYRQSCQHRSRQHDPVLVPYASDSVPPHRPTCAVLAMPRLQHRSPGARNCRTSRHAYMPVRSLDPGIMASGTLGFLPQRPAGGHDRALGSSQRVTRSRRPQWTARHP